MNFQWASDDRCSHVRANWVWFMLELRHTYQQDNINCMSACAYTML